jgi:hypothetical protein
MSALVFAERMGRRIRGRGADGKGYTKGIPRVYKNSRYIGYITRGISTSTDGKNTKNISHPTGILRMVIEW